MKTEHAVAIGITAAALIGIVVMYVKQRQAAPSSPTLQQKTGTTSTSPYRFDNPILRTQTTNPVVTAPINKTTQIFERTGNLDLLKTYQTRDIIV